MTEQRGPVDGTDHPESPATSRYDHRDTAAREADAAEEEVIDRPLQDGAEDLRESVAEVERRGGIEGDPSAPR